MRGPGGATLKEEVLAVLPEAFPEEAEHLLEVLGSSGAEVTRGAAPALVMMAGLDKATLLACLDLLDPAAEKLARQRLAPHLERLARRAGLARLREARLTGSAPIGFGFRAAEQRGEG